LDAETPIASFLKAKLIGDGRSTPQFFRLTLLWTTLIIMAINPFDRPNQAERSSKRPAEISGWWVAVPYFMPLLIMFTFLNEAGWYGTGSSGWLQGWFRLAAFFFGVGCAYYVLIAGSTIQKPAAAPAALGYTTLVLGILWDHYL
jgi:hypothetical protein